MSVYTLNEINEMIYNIQQLIEDAQIKKKFNCC